MLFLGSEIINHVSVRELGLKGGCWQRCARRAGAELWDLGMVGYGECGGSFGVLRWVAVEVCGGSFGMFGGELLGYGSFWDV